MAELINEAFLLLGGNMGDREGFLSFANEQIEEKCGTISSMSSIYETAAWGKQDQEKFLNQVVCVDTTLAPTELLRTILEIEARAGRKRELKYGPRVIDIDILLYEDVVVVEPGLTIPHSQLQNRRFALVPLAEIAGEKVHPILKKTIGQLVDECPDHLDVNKFK